MLATKPNPDATVDDIRYAYRLFLGREPDEAGFEHYQKMLAAKPVTVAEIARLFTGSPEYRSSKFKLESTAEVNMSGYSMFVREDDKAIGFWIKQTGQWEPHVTKVAKSILRAGDTVVDVGANIGYFSALASSIVGSSGVVVAVEPMEKNVQLIYATAWRNNWHYLRVHQVAASDEIGLVSVATAPGTSNGAVRAASNIQNEPPTLIAQCMPLDVLLGDMKRIDLVKFDIEGFELKAWKGFEKTLRRTRPKILTEFHPKCLRENSCSDPETYLQALFGYTENIQVISQDGRITDCSTTKSVMQHWVKEDRRLNEQGNAHLDLLVVPR